MYNFIITKIKMPITKKIISKTTENSILKIFSLFAKFAKQQVVIITVIFHADDNIYNDKKVNTALLIVD